jgi:hypothetical protein
MKHRRTVWPTPVAQVIEFRAGIQDALILGLGGPKSKRKPPCLAQAISLAKELNDMYALGHSAGQRAKFLEPREP